MAELHHIHRTKRFKDLTGQTIHLWTVLEFSHRNEHFRNFWLCRCACGTVKTIAAPDLIDGKTLSCGCRNKPKVAPPTKRCKSCKTVFAFTSQSFPTSAQHPFGLKAVCRTCYNAWTAEKNNRRNRRVRFEVLSHYSGGGKPHCVCCGVDFVEFLSIDHIHGRNGEKSHPNICLKLKADGLPEGFQTLCHNCNMALGHHRCCPHRPEIIRPMKPLSTNAKAVASRLRGQEIRLAVLTHYSGGVPACSCCGETALQFLAIDHIEGGGSQHRKQIKGRIEHWLVRSGFPDGFRILCHNCNCSHGFFGRCPHDAKRPSSSAREHRRS